MMKWLRKDKSKADLQAIKNAIIAHAEIDKNKISDEAFVTIGNQVTEFLRHYQDDFVRNEIYKLFSPFCESRLAEIEKAVNAKKFDLVKESVAVYLKALPQNPIALNLLEKAIGLADEQGKLEDARALSELLNRSETAKLESSIKP
ncbi:MAG TPA: hypothetical protein VD770_00775 [Coxiellaceae bacterium]|nr:hypothetical protein [Coxiellaceae bacterium]